MAKNTRVVWSDDKGDLRKKKDASANGHSSVKEADLTLHVRRLTSGKGRTVLEIKGLPNNKAWCKALAKEIKKSLGVGGAYKDDYIEIHGENMERLTEILEKKNLKWKKTGG